MERPDMTAALKQAGWANYTLFLSEDGLVVGYLEAGDYQAALERMAQTAVNARWPKSFTATERRPRSAGWR
jgi:L-rhamnose mutarotase